MGVSITNHFNLKLYISLLSVPTVAEKKVLDHQLLIHRPNSQNLIQIMTTRSGQVTLDYIEV